MIRYEIERDLVNGLIEVRDLPTIWNAKYKEYLGVDVKNDAEGVLQDIHWSDGSFGYFPTYSLGTIYATQLFHAIERAIPDIRLKLEKGELLDIKTWLQMNVHTHGSLKTSSEIMEQATGKKIDVDGYVAYVREKFSKVYGVNI